MLRELLDAWDEGYLERPDGRALALLHLARPAVSVEHLATIPVGQRDAELLEVRGRVFGPETTALTDCPRCSCAIELRFGLSQIEVGGSQGDDPLLIEADGFTIEYRLPTSLDVRMAASAGDLNEARRILIERCVTRAVAQGQDVEAVHLSEDALTELVQAMAQASPASDIEMLLSCPVCGHDWSAPFDIAPFLWEEVDGWVRRTATDVHVLASAYGWTEESILDMSAQRRRLYLELAQQ